MLEELLIRDLGVIDAVVLELAPGLNVVTGETGAGKTMVVNALELLLGGRAEASQVRAGARAALVEGRLRPAPAAATGEWLDEGDDELVVARELVLDPAGGGVRSRARVQGRLAPASALTAVVGGAVEVHGQQESVGLGTAAVQRELLDRSGGAPVAAALGRFRTCYDRWREAADELEALRGSEQERLREIDRLAFEVAEIDAAAPVAGEEVALEAELARTEHAEQLAGAARTAAAALADDGGARDAVGVALVALRGAAGVDTALDELHRRAEAVAAEVQELALDLSGYVDQVDLDPARLDVLRERRAVLARLTRKYGERGGDIDAAAVAAYADAARQRLAVLRQGDERARFLEKDVARFAAEVEDAGRELRELRQAAGRALADAVEGHLAELAMADARMEVRVEPAPPGPNGADRVTFLLAANAGGGLLPLAKVASGGERSRIALAVRLALADADDTAVLVFDEVDAGVGGATALALGRKLARLARGRQVLCVTHLAQLAAFADAHFVVSKATTGATTTASVQRLDERERVVELSRMLSGTPGSSRAAEHAEELRQRALADFPS